jgi:hypothetical protein
VGIETESEKFEFVSLDELLGNTVHNRVQEVEALTDSQR